jgi:phosphatidylinositol-3-phosphatase
VPHAHSALTVPRTGSFALAAGLLAASVLVVSCSSGGATQATPTSTRSSSSVAPRVTAASGRSTLRRSVCGGSGPVPKRYRSVVVFAFENRTWSDVGLGFGSAMPYLHRLGRQCSYFGDWTETDTHQNSLTQYVGQLTGGFQSRTVNDCSPSASCSTRADNLFRQARRAGLTAVNYVEGATVACSADGNAAKHIPGLYMWGADDRSSCNAQVRPLRDFNPARLPSFAFITPTLCNDGHDCGNATVDTWARAHVQPVLDSAAYRSGMVAVFIWYDEDHPVPNLWIAPTARSGAVAAPGSGYAGTLAAWESMLGLPCLAGACTAPNMRAAARA